MLRKWFERNGFYAALCPGMAAAREALLQTESFQVILSDLRLPDGDGIMLLSWLNERRLPIPVIIMTGYGEIRTAVAAIKLGAFDFLEKPVNPDILAKKIEAAFEAGRVSASPPEKRTAEGGKPHGARGGKAFVEGRNPVSAQMYAHIDLVAPTRMAVMITGESGTGKEHVARLIHDRSGRADGPFVAVDCGSLSIELAPSELFGHKKGAFTSAIEDRSGFFREADGGTLFLDEVGNLSCGVQMQLLRALQEKKVRPVGTSSDVDMDVRIITATNEDLDRAIGTGSFREDLYHRLNEFMIRVPPLRECADDLASYADFFREEANRELDREVISVSPEALAALKGYSWPGNLRELRNVIRRAVLFTGGDCITPDSLPALAARREPALREEADVSPFVEPEREREKILRALALTRGNKTRAAVLLQIDRKTLYNKMHQYDIGL
jgi:two-component system response regulator HydG